MKKMIIPVLAFVLFGFSADTNKLSNEDRKFAIKHLKETRNHMTHVLKGLSEEQLNFKPYEDSWSIAECVEHLAISESAFGGLIKRTAASEPNPVLKDSLVFNDEQLLKVITDRSQKVKTSEQFEPSGQFGSHEETVEAFMTKRNEHIEYTKTTEDDLRNRFSKDLPFGTVDGVQLLLFAAAHSERHILQMEEVMATENFPAKKE
ncbi:DinB family protein [Flagellimonas nanhaiensis]|uniref:DinB family protein n=1 Tax=Flagellimonas nanhaiensis TaxID=2292706 RepID=A0A371JQ09_9FLAO|nr:DinB family protein [Allomuricauda nanhaiensis]RDY59605.1 DinB family protein [Allomuricauda nanhaiensis]